MNPNAGKELEDAINLATSELLAKPNRHLLLQICNNINSRTDMPKVAISVIQKRLLSKSPKTVFLTLDLIEAAAICCGVPFLNQLNNLEPINALGTLSTKHLNKEVFEKYVKVIKFLTQHLTGHKDRFPRIFKLYAYLQSKGIVFPGVVESSYNDLKTTKQNPQTVAQPEVSKQKSAEKPSPSPRKTEDKQISDDPTRKRLKIVKEDLELINDMIDAHDPKDNVLKNDILTELIKQAQKIETSLQKFICTIESDEELMAFCINLHEELVTTLERYECLKSGKKTVPRPGKVPENKVTEKADTKEKTQEETSNPLFINDSLFAHFYELPFTNQNEKAKSETQTPDSKKDATKQDSLTTTTPQNTNQVLDLMNMDLEETASQENSTPEAKNEGRGKEQNQKSNQEKEQLKDHAVDEISSRHEILEKEFQLLALNERRSYEPPVINQTKLAEVYWTPQLQKQHPYPVKKEVLTDLDKMFGASSQKAMQNQISKSGVTQRGVGPQQFNQPPGNRWSYPMNFH